MKHPPHPNKTRSSRHRYFIFFSAATPIPPFLHQLLEASSAKMEGNVRHRFNAEMPQFLPTNAPWFLRSHFLSVSRVGRSIYFKRLVYSSVRKGCRTLSRVGRFGDMLHLLFWCTECILLEHDVVELGRYATKFRRTMKSTYHPTWRHTQHVKSPLPHFQIRYWNVCFTDFGVRNAQQPWISEPVCNFRNRVCCLSFGRNITPVCEYVYLRERKIADWRKVHAGAS